jgi:hypothetical protein
MLLAGAWAAVVKIGFPSRVSGPPSVFGNIPKYTSKETLGISKRPPAWNQRLPGWLLQTVKGGPIMAYQRIPTDPYRPNRTDDEIRNAALDSELQPDPELAEGPVSGGRIALFAVAIAVVLGAVFYGLNNSSLNSNGTTTAQTVPANQNTAQTAPPVPPGVRDVTPRGNNTEPGTTTGAAPARPQQPPAPAPTGADLNRSGNPPTANDAPAAK